MNEPQRPDDISDHERAVVAERLKTADEDAKTAIDAKQALKEIRRNLQQPAPR